MATGSVPVSDTNPAHCTPDHDCDHHDADHGPTAATARRHPGRHDDRSLDRRDRPPAAPIT